MKKPKTNMQDYDCITQQLKLLIESHPDYESHSAYVKKYEIGDLIKAAARYTESTGVVLLKSGKQTVKTTGTLQALFFLVSKREKARSIIEKPKKPIIRHSTFNDQKRFPAYFIGMSTEEYVSQWLNIGKKPYEKEDCEYSVKANVLWLQNKQAALSYFKSLNNKPATNYDSSFPEVVEEISE